MTCAALTKQGKVCRNKKLGKTDYCYVHKYYTSSVEPETTEPIVEPVTVEPIVEPVTVEPIVEPVTVEPIVEPVTVEPIVEPVTVEPIVEPVIEPLSLPEIISENVETTSEVNHIFESFVDIEDSGLLSSQEIDEEDSEIFIPLSSILDMMGSDSSESSNTVELEPVPVEPVPVEPVPVEPVPVEPVPVEPVPVEPVPVEPVPVEPVPVEPVDNIKELDSLLNAHFQTQEKHFLDQFVNKTFDIQSQSKTVQKEENILKVNVNELHQLQEKRLNLLNAAIYGFIHIITPDFCLFKYELLDSITEAIKLAREMKN